MISFPVFKELEAHRDKINARFHRETEPLLRERFGQFGFTAATDDGRCMVLTESSTGNEYRLAINTYEIVVDFVHVKRGKSLKICEISNLSLSAHDIMNIIIASIDSWLQYGVVYDYISAQRFTTAGAASLALKAV